MADSRAAGKDPTASYDKRLRASAEVSAAGAHDPDLGILLAIAYRAMIDHLTARLAAAGFPDVQPPHGYMFRALQGEGRTSTELAGMLGISKQATIKIIDQMEARGLAARHAVAEDRRAKIVRLTDRGIRAMQTAIRINQQLEAEFAERIGAEHAAHMREALMAFVETYGGRADARARRARPVW